MSTSTCKCTGTTRVCSTISTSAFSYAMRSVFWPEMTCSKSFSPNRIFSTYSGCRTSISPMHASPPIIMSLSATSWCGSNPMDMSLTIRGESRRLRYTNKSKCSALQWIFFVYSISVIGPSTSNRATLSSCRVRIRDSYTHLTDTLQMPTRAMQLICNGFLCQKASSQSRSTT